MSFYNNEQRPSPVAQRFQKVQTQIADAQAAQPEPVAPTLIVVTKTFPFSAIRALLESGHRDFGENRLQEAQQKWSEAKAQYSDLRLHALGALQHNKIRATVSLFDCIHTLDRPRIAYGLAEEMARSGKSVPCFIQVNIGQEPQKSGVAIDDLSSFLHLCRDVCHLTVMGLMGIPPRGQHAAPFFSLLREMAQREGLEALSMGMSADYSLALACGATHLRIGSAIMGARQENPLKS